MTQTLLGIDWGTSNRRAYVVERGGRCVAQHADGQGLLAVGGRFADSLAELRSALGLDSTPPVVMSGMVGSKNGWQEVPYLDLATPLDQLPRHLAAVRGQPNTFIVPGYAACEPSIDVMRGEETQLLGAVALGRRDGWMVLPGTHSKWVHLRDGRVEQLSTFMTGELFAMLGEHGTLSAMFKDAGDDAGAFRMGLEQARRAEPLTHSLFGVRARVVTGAMPAAQARSFASGLLIGTEFVAAEARGQRQPIHLIASTALSERYAQAAAFFGLEARVLDPDAVYLAALHTFFTEV
jgi:2-dehydro-3-deoxygalactonokinase